MAEQLPRSSLDQLQTFHRVATSGSFTMAARALGLPKSTVSQQIRTLEARLGTRLIHRTTRRLALTEIGQVFLAHCERMIAEAEQAEKAVSDYTAEPCGLLRVGIPMTFARTFLAPMLPGFCRAYPRVSIELVIPGGRLDPVENLLDLAIRIGGPLADSSYVIRKLGSIPQALFASREYLSAHAAPEHPGFLAAHQLISTGRSPNGSRWRLHGPGGQEEEVRFEPRLTLPDPVMVRQMAVAGMGIGLVPDFLIDSDSPLVRVLPAWRATPVEVFALYPAGRLTPLKLRVFLEELERNIPFARPAVS